MDPQLYEEEYVIVAGAVRDEIKVKYNSIASITGETSAGRRTVQLFTVFGKRHLTYEGARAAALEAAKAWVDQRRDTRSYREIAL